MRRDLLQRFPDDSTADDVYAACRAAEVGGRIALSLTPVMELRAAQGPLEFCRHKHRKALGYLREVRRFLPRVRRMQGPAAAAFQFRAALLAALPLVALVAVAAGLLLSAKSPLAAGLMTAVIVAPVAGVPFPERVRALGVLGWLPLVAVIITSAVIVGPFCKQTSAYPSFGPRRGQQAA
jgi:hypothetical protein